MVIILVNKTPGIAAVLSFLIPGLGQIYNGNFSSGALHLIVHGIGVWIIFTTSSFFLGIGIILINAGLACYRAYYDAEEFNAQLLNKSTSAENQEGFAWNNTYNYKNHQTHCFGLRYWFGPLIVASTTHTFAISIRSW